MFDRLNPLIYFVAILPVSLIALALGYRYAARFAKNASDKEGWAWGLGQAAIFGLITLILAFSYSRAAERFEARSELVVSESNAIGTAYLKAGFLPAAEATRFRSILIAYTRRRLDAYASVGDVGAERRAIDNGKTSQNQLWLISANAARRDSRPAFVDLTRSVIDVMDAAEQQEAAFNNHVPGVILGIVVFSTLIGALLFGLTLGRASHPNALLAVIFCLLFSATVYTILDLDHPQGGFIGVDVSPLQATLSDMTRYSAILHNSNVSQSYGTKPRPMSSQPSR